MDTMKNSSALHKGASGPLNIYKHINGFFDLITFVPISLQPHYVLVTHHSQIVVNVLETFATYSGASAWPLGCCSHWIPAKGAERTTELILAAKKKNLQVAMFNLHVQLKFTRKLCLTKLTSTKKRISTLMLGKTSSMGNVGEGILCWNLYTPWKIHVEPEFSPVFVKGKSSSNQPMIFGLPHVPQKRPSLTFHYTGCSIGILIMVHNSYNPHLTG